MSFNLALQSHWWHTVSAGCTYPHTANSVHRFSSGTYTQLYSWIAYVQYDVCMYFVAIEVLMGKTIYWVSAFVGVYHRNFSVKKFGSIDQNSALVI